MAIVGICRSGIHAFVEIFMNHAELQESHNNNLKRQLNNVALFLLNDHRQVAFSSLLAKATIR